jgi:hypothetical protein
MGLVVASICGGASKKSTCASKVHSTHQRMLFAGKGLFELRNRAVLGI